MFYCIRRRSSFYYWRVSFSISDSWSRIIITTTRIHTICFSSVARILHWRGPPDNQTLYICERVELGRKVLQRHPYTLCILRLCIRQSGPPLPSILIFRDWRGAWTLSVPLSGYTADLLICFTVFMPQISIAKVQYPPGHHVRSRQHIVFMIRQHHYTCTSWH